MNHIFQTSTLLIRDNGMYNGLCKHMKRVRSSKPAILVPDWIKHSFSLWVSLMSYRWHSHKKRKDSLKTRAVLLIFSLELEISGVAVQSIHQNRNNGDLCEELLTENDFEAVLVTFCCYDLGGKASEAVQKIDTDQKEYRKCSLCIIIYWKAAEVAQKKEQ